MRSVGGGKGSPPKQNKLWLHSDDLDDFANWCDPTGSIVCLVQADDDDNDNPG